MNELYERQLAHGGRHGNHTPVSLAPPSYQEADKTRRRLKRKPRDKNGRRTKTLSRISKIVKPFAVEGIDG